MVSKAVCFQLQNSFDNIKNKSIKHKLTLEWGLTLCFMSTLLSSIWVILLLTVYIVIITSSNLELVSFQFHFSISINSFKLQSWKGIVWKCGHIENRPFFARMTNLNMSKICTENYFAYWNECEIPQSNGKRMRNDPSNALWALWNCD